MNASRKYFGSSDLRGQVYVSSGLGGMSGAQAKAAVIAGAIGVIAEVDPSPLKKRHAQGWVQEVADSLDACIERVKIAKKNREPLSLAYAGNVVDLLERLASEEELLVDLASDQTSLHNPYNGGYYPVQLSFDEAQKVMASDPPKFKSLVQESLRRHVASINKLVSRGMRFWDYGNCFLLEASRANADIFAPDSTASIPKFKYPSYVEHFMGDIFSLGFGPFRWICTSGDPVDLRETDLLAQEQIKKMIESTPPNVADQHRDNLYWIQHAEENRLVVGSQARILYSDAEGRVKLAVEFNKAIASGRIKGPIVLSRDHHDVSGTDSPFRETADVYDGSSVCAGKFLGCLPI
jgi:urocanate hydratase